MSTFLARGSEIAKNLMIYRLEIQKELWVTFQVHRTYVQISSYAYLGHIRALQGSRRDICVKEIFFDIRITFFYETQVKSVA